MKHAILAELNKERNARRAVITLQEIKSGDTRLVREHEVAGDAFATELSQAFRTGKSRMVEHDGNEYFLNVYLPPLRLVVIGAVHISQHLAGIAAVTGFDVELIDPRTAFATPERFGEAKLTADWPETVLAENPLDPYCALIAVTHDPKIDDFPLTKALEAGCFYVGALGSRKTHAKRLERLTAEGVGLMQLKKIDAPIGLDIGAANPAEIAIAIMAQLVQAFRQRGADEI